MGDTIPRDVERFFTRPINDAPSRWSFQAICSGLYVRRNLEGDPWLEAEAWATPYLATWDPVHRVLHDADGWNISETPAPWSRLINGLIFFAWGPWDAQFEALASHTHLTSLQCFEAHEGRLTDAAAQALGTSGVWDHLTRLVLTRVSLTDQRAQALVAGSALREVRELDVSRNPIGEEGLKALLTRMAPHLETLDIVGTRLKSDGLIRLLDAHPLPLLRKLWIRGSTLSDAALTALIDADLTSLEFIELGYLPGLTQTMAARLATGRLAHTSAKIEVNGVHGDKHPQAILALASSPHPDLKALAVALLEDLKVKALQEVARAYKLTGRSRLRRQALLDRITEAINL